MLVRLKEVDNQRHNMSEVLLTSSDTEEEDADEEYEEEVGVHLSILNHVYLFTRKSCEGNCFMGVLT